MWGAALLLADVPLSPPRTPPPGQNHDLIAGQGIGPNGMKLE
ncbi:hypothetical protein HMPREF0277_0203 [Corynebacterium accolens ATCC 49726]|nr:hypothetical protein HMPREF0277_0203 [Corynebacterium accolens ATCC 49726]